MPNVLLQFYVFLKRETTLTFRYIKSLMMDMFLVLLAGGILGALYSEVRYTEIEISNVYRKSTIPPRGLQG